MGEYVKVHLHHLGVVGDFLTGAGPVLQVARTKVGGVQVALGFRQGKLIRDVSKSCDFHASDVQRRDVFPVVVDHRQTLADMFEGFALLDVVVEEARSGAFVAVDDEVNEASATLAGCSEFDRPERVDDGKHHRRLAFVGRLLAEEAEHVTNRRAELAVVGNRGEEHQGGTCHRDVLEEARRLGLLGLLVGLSPEVVHLHCHENQQDGEHESPKVGVDTEHYGNCAEHHEHAGEVDRWHWHRHLLELRVALHRLGLGEVVEAICYEDKCE